MRALLLLLLLISGMLSCTNKKVSEIEEEPIVDIESTEKLLPKYTTPPLPNDSDDPAIWYNKNDPQNSIIIGTDKGDGNGGLYAFRITGDSLPAREVYPLLRPNNVDVAYGLQLGDSVVDIAVVTERIPGKIRVYSMPDLQELDNGGIHVFEDDTANAVMGVALYTRNSDGAIFAAVSRKSNPVDEDDYLYQYRLDGSSGTVKGELVRKFGKFSGEAEIEAIAVDNELGFIYYSDEMTGIRKYHADPDKGNEELALFGREGFLDDREGISIYKNGPGTGYILVSDQGANKFRVYPREGYGGEPNYHPEIAVIDMNTLSSDGSEVSSLPFGDEFPNGVFVAMSDNRTFEIYDWRDLQKAIDDQMESTENE